MFKVSLLVKNVKMLFIFYSPSFVAAAPQQNISPQVAVVQQQAAAHVAAAQQQAAAHIAAAQQQAAAEQQAAVPSVPPHGIGQGNLAAQLAAAQIATAHLQAGPNVPADQQQQLATPPNVQHGMAGQQRIFGNVNPHLVVHGSVGGLAFGGGSSSSDMQSTLSRSSGSTGSFRSQPALPVKPTFYSLDRLQNIMINV